MFDRHEKWTVECMSDIRDQIDDVRKRLESLDRTMPVGSRPSSSASSTDAPDRKRRTDDRQWYVRIIW